MVDSLTKNFNFFAFGTPYEGAYIMDDMDVHQGLSNSYPLQTKISTKFFTLCRQMVENF